jgi:predicted Zn finger-like uncharacterized protein
MALMTACPACNTRFKVVPDQLRLHHGLVRCGSCAHVFDANTRLESLQENGELGRPGIIQPGIDPNSPEGWINKPAVLALSGQETLGTTPDKGWTELLPPNIQHQTGASTSDAQRADNPLTAIVDPEGKLRIVPDFSGSTAIINSENSGGEVHLATDGMPWEALPQSFQTPAPTLNTESFATPSKSQVSKKRSASRPAAERTKAKREQKKRRSKAATKPSKAWSKALSATMFGLCVVAFCALALQLIVAARYQIADAMAASKPLLEQLCAPLECDLEPAVWLAPQTLDALSLNKINPYSQSTADMQPYRMQATVRNSSQLRVRTPDIELTISNAQGTVIARKTLSAKQLGSEPTLAPNSDWIIDSNLLLDQQTIGYTARLVYLP